MSERRDCTNWLENVQPVVTAACDGCHAGEQAEGAYRTTSYLEALGVGGDEVANLIAGDAESRFLTVLGPDDPVPEHHISSADLELFRTWVVDCELAYFDSYVHDPRLLNPADDQFHGKLVRSLGWDFQRCARCHGEDFAGGRSGVACTTCHTDGPTACNVCHGSVVNPAPPRALDGSTATTAIGVGAHQTHLLGGDLGKVWECTECHVVPEVYNAPGHILLADGSVDESPAEIAFGNFAGTTLEPADRAGPPAWNREAEACENVYCHGDALGDSAATNSSPRWTNVGAGEAMCGACHGLPPADHARDQCALCHSRVADATPAIIDTALHINGTVEVGDGSGMCTGCHGRAGIGPAPPRDLDGNDSSAAVGAHTTHLTAGRLRGPVPCESCHLVPAEIIAPGHIDSTAPAEVFPDDPAFQSLASADGASPIWNRDGTTCTDVYCHGNGDHLAGDTTPGLNRSPNWTRGVSQTVCGACHGLPPTDANHGGAITLNDCATCHPSTVDPFGNIIITGPPDARTSTHINGVPDAI